MEQFHLIIQKTTTGLSVDYSSPGIDPEHPNVSATLEDERDITQIVKESDVYSLKITNQYRIYSLIVKDSDNFGRPGFYEFKLYGPRNYPLPNFVDILQAIKLLYEENTNNKPYEELLSTILITPHTSKDNYILVKPNNKKYYSFFQENDSNSLKETFNDKGVYIISKLYAFNRLKAYGEPVIKEVGLLPFSKGHFREVVISNPHGVLNQLFLNNEKLPVNNFKEEFKILIEPIDLLTYSTSDSKSIKTIVGPIVRIERKPMVPIPIPPPRKYAKNKSFLEENGIYLAAILIMIGVAGFGYFKDPTFFNFFPPKETTEFVNSPVPEDSIKIIDTLQFKKNSNADSLHFIPVRKGLNHYIFSYAKDQWLYKNTKRKNVYNEFDRTIVKDLDVLDSMVFTSEEQLKFIVALEQESGEQIDSIKAKETVSPPIVPKNKKNALPSAKTKIKEKEDETPTPKTTDLIKIGSDN